MASLNTPRPGSERRSSYQASSFFERVANAKKEFHDTSLTPPASLPSSPELASDRTTPRVEGDAGDSPAVEPVSPTDAADAADVADSFVFAFDIDGVLVRGGEAIPEAIQAMKVLDGDNEFNIQVPHIFLTNGGGKTELERCQDLSRQLERDIKPGQFICGHTPMREMAEKYGTVLVIGGEGEKCRIVAEGYGFKDVVTPGDIIKHDGSTTPFRKLTDEEHANSRSRDFNDVVIDAVFVFADSRDWAGDIQIMLDLAMSKGGKLATRSETFDEGPPFYFSHNDVVWSAAHEHVRLGMGALARMFEVTFKDLTAGKGKLHTHAFGKPQVPTFEFAYRLMSQWRSDEHGLAGPPKTVYFVGDTPESDIRGTNAVNEKADNDWYSILVETGVYEAGSVPTYKPRTTVPNVLDAVNHGIQREMRKKVSTKLHQATAVGDGKGTQAVSSPVILDEDSAVAV